MAKKKKKSNPLNNITIKPKIYEKPEPKGADSVSDVPLVYAERL